VVGECNDLAGETNDDDDESSKESNDDESKESDNDDDNVSTKESDNDENVSTGGKHPYTYDHTSHAAINIAIQTSKML
jgi:hypothetical protein